VKILSADHLRTWQQIDPENWRSIVDEIYGVFFDSELRKFGDIMEAWKLRDLERISRVAHSLKSSCGNVGAEKAKTLLHEIEHLAFHAREKDLRICMLRLQEVFPQTVVALAALREKIHAA